MQFFVSYSLRPESFFLFIDATLSVRMDDMLNNVAVRFHFNGQFSNDGRNVCYVGGREEMSYIDRDKVSLPEVIGHLKDHCSVEEGTLLHWLFPGKDLKTGLRVLVDDKACLDMSDAIVEGGVAEIYVEMTVRESEAEEATNIEDGLEAMDDVDSHQIVIEESREQVQKQVKKVIEFYRSPSKKGKEVVSEKEQVQHEENNSSSDSDYLPGDVCSSEDDE
jgi:alpha-galactosidase